MQRFTQLVAIWDKPCKEFPFLWKLSPANLEWSAPVFTSPYLLGARTSFRFHMLIFWVCEPTLRKLIKECVEDWVWVAYTKKMMGLSLGGGWVLSKETACAKLQVWEKAQVFRQLKEIIEFEFKKNVWLEIYLEPSSRLYYEFFFSLSNCVKSEGKFFWWYMLNMFMLWIVVNL